MVREDETIIFQYVSAQIFDRLGWLLQHVLKPILKQIPAHLSNTADLLERFKTTPADELRSKLPVSFDVISLYTNINGEEAIETTLECALETLT